MHCIAWIESVLRKACGAVLSKYLDYASRLFQVCALEGLGCQLAARPMLGHLCRDQPDLIAAEGMTESGCDAN
jgi:hypothetical protein